MSELTRATPKRSEGAISDYMSELSFVSPHWPDVSPVAQHTPLYLWLVDALQPKSIVDIGLVDGSSYFAFCQAVRQLKLSCQCLGVFACPSREPVGIGNRDEITTYSFTHYSDFSRISDISDLPQTETEVAEIDLLHISNCLDDVTLETKVAPLISRLSSTCVLAIVGTNDTKLTARWKRFLDQLRDQFSIFEFSHGAGLLVSGKAQSLTEPLSALLAGKVDDKTVRLIRSLYCRLGQSVVDRVNCENLAEANNTVHRLKQQLQLQSYLASTSAQKGAEVYALKKDIEALRKQRSFYLHFRSLIGRSPFGPRLRRIRDRLSGGS